jgi:hypothetical protein
MLVFLDRGSDGEVVVVRVEGLVSKETWRVLCCLGDDVGSKDFLLLVLLLLVLFSSGPTLTTDRVRWRVTECRLSVDTAVDDSNGG